LVRRRWAREIPRSARRRRLAADPPLSFELHVFQLSSNLIAYTTALLIAVLLLVLTLRAARLPGTPVANIVFAICAVLWTVGGLVATIMKPAGLATFVPRSIQFTAVLAVVVPVLAAWGARRMAQFATLAGGVLTVLVWWDRLPRPLIAHYAAAVLIAGFVTSPVRRAPRVIFLPSLTIVIAAVSAVILSTAELSGHLVFLVAHVILLAVLCGFFLFARFRYADTFVRYGVRLLLAGTLAAILFSSVESQMIVHTASRVSSAATFHAFAVSLFAIAFLLTLTLVDDAISIRLIHWLFRAPDYAAEVAALGQRLRGLDNEGEIGAALEDSARRSLDLSSATVEPSGGPAAQGDEVVVPISTERVLRVSPGPTRPGLVSNDLLYLRDLATQAATRLDTMRREREALLVQQVTEAELRALQAQVNPHFLFNSLNTIADLTVRDPAKAETMTVRLAAVFRHVLAQSARPLTTVRDELEFLRTYLYIEEVRFGDRLQVSIEAASEVEIAQIPSLILQPLVENALKHGLGPKPGPGHLWIRAAADGTDVRLTVEDDGLGLRNGPEGVGLTNITDRLRTLYGGRASVVVEARGGGGCRAAVRIPRV
jgi:two-component system LytT family sensor kinase